MNKPTTLADAISKVEDDTVTFDSACAETFIEAEFVYAMVVDSAKESIVGTTHEDDDGDGMFEKYTNEDTSYIWQARIDSKHIPDGPIEIHCVVFDEAGNISSGWTKTYVSNNPPRITSVMLGTDLDADGKYTIADTVADSEFMQYWVDTSDSHNKTTGTDVWNLDAMHSNTKYWTAKKDLVVIPEFVGGTGNIYYAYSKQTTVSDENKITTPQGTGLTQLAENSSDLILPASKTLANNYKLAENKIGVLILKNDNSDGAGKISTTTGDYEKNGDDGINIYRFSFWDSTEECTPGTDSQWTILNVTLKQDLADNTAPEGFIKPFYWIKENGAINSSVVYDEDGVAQGHIELENDWINSDYYKGLAATARTDEYDADPKVSGKIKIEGTAYDETMLKTIKVTFDNKSVTATYTPYDKTLNGVTTPKGWSYATNIADFTLEVTDAKGPTQDGHSVTWTYTVDTSKASAVAGTEREIKVEVNDTSSNANAVGSDSTETGNMTPYYKVDVVPYIMSILRNGSYNTNRARSGAISLLREEGNNAIKGFNLNSTTNTSIKIVPNKNGSGTAVEMNDVELDGDDLSFTVPASAKSGYLHVVVNGVAALNNMNGYVAYNTETNAKAYDHNTLTDDRYVHIWRVSQQDTFKGSKNAVYPAMARGSDGTLYASFTNYGQSKTYYTKSFIGTGTVGVSDFIGVNNTVNRRGELTSQTTVDAIQTNGVATVFWGYDPPEETAIALGSSDDVSVFFAANYHGGASTHWNGTAATNAGGIYVYDTHATPTQIQNNGESSKQSKIYRSELYTYDDELNQFKNLRITRSGDYIYLAYYDRLRGSIKTSVINDGTGSRPDTSTNGLPWVTLDGDSDNIDKNGTGVSFAGGWTPFLNTNYGNGVTARTNATGESVAITTNSSGYPIVLYMDAETGCPRIATASSASPTNVNSWRVQGVFPSSDENYNTASDYMSCAVDSQGYLHIAFQNTRGQLVYAKSTNNPSNGSTAFSFVASQVLDDSGMWIDMTMNNGVPYISYLSRVNSYDGMKIAFLDSNFDENNDGVADTGGGWETITAALNAKVTNIRTCIEPNAKANNVAYTAAIGFSPGSDYRAAFYVGQ